MHQLTSLSLSADNVGGSNLQSQAREGATIPLQPENITHLISLKAMVHTDNLGWTVLRQPCYSLCIAPLDFHLFGLMRDVLCGQHFLGNSTSIEAVKLWFTSTAAGIHQHEMKDLLHHWWKRCWLWLMSCIRETALPNSIIALFVTAVLSLESNRRHCLQSNLHTLQDLLALLTATLQATLVGLQHSEMPLKSWQSYSPTAFLTEADSKIL